MSENRPGGSGLGSTESWWQFFWRFRLPLKVKIFMWKACNDWIPTGVNLMRHGLKTDIRCPLCLKSGETTLHALWRCRSLREVRAGSCVDDGGFHKQWDVGSFLDFVMVCKSAVSSLNFEVLCVVWWRIWFRRNQFVHSNGSSSFMEVLDWAHSYLQDFRKASKMENPSLVLERASPKWKPPDQGVYKINTDAALDERGFQSGIGVIIRDYQGHVMASLCQNFKACYKPQIVEAMAVLKGIWLAANTGLLPASLDSDALSVVNLVNSKEVPAADIGVVI